MENESRTRRNTSATNPGRTWNIDGDDFYGQSNNSATLLDDTGI